MINNKKGISTMIEYVLLIVIVVGMSSIVYVWMKTYVPQDEIACEDGVSIYITNLNCSYSESNSSIEITLRNSGRFSIRGFFIRATNQPEQELAILDLSPYLVKPEKLSNEVLFGTVSASSKNTFLPTEEKTFYFENIPSQVYSIEMIPTRLEETSGNPKLASCGDAKINEEISCS